MQNYYEKNNKKTNPKKALNSQTNGIQQSIVNVATNNKIANLAELHSIGRCIKGKMVKKNTLASSVTDFMNDVITQVSPNSKNEEIIWTKIQICMKGPNENQTLIVIIIGLSRGYQIYLMQNDNFEEVLSVRKAPLKNGLLLPLHVEKNDKFQKHRPLFASMFEELSSSEEYSLNFQSLNSGQIVHRLTFDNPIVDIDSSSSCFLVFSARAIILYNHEDLSERMRIKIPANPSIFSMTSNLLAFADEKLDQSILSCGNPMDDNQILNNHVITTAKTITKTMTTIGGSLVSTLSSTPPSRNSSTLGGTKKLGIVTIVNIDSTLKSANNSVDKFDYVAHFCAYNKSTIGHIKFGHGGQLLLTGSSSSTIFKIFLINLHPSKCSLTSVQHIYSLVRGNSAAKTVASSFSLDNRWIAISTNHGTTHLFAITPYGPTQITTRTHQQKIKNKESRFEKTTGKSTFSTVQQQNLSPTKNLFQKTHSGAKKLTILRTVQNPLASMTFDSKPLALYSTILAKQRIFSSENIRAWASDNAPKILNSTKSDRSIKNHGNVHPKEFALKRSIAFVDGLNKQQCLQTSGSLLMLEGDGILTQYGIQVDPLPNNSQHQQKKLIETSSDTEQLNKSAEESQKGTTNCSVSPINAQLTQIMQWDITRENANFQATNPPLHPKNALMKLHGREEQRDESNQSWLQFFEVNTYMGPHRRLWLGPQFSFNIHSHGGNVQSSTLKSRPMQINGLEKFLPVLVQRNTPEMDSIRPPEIVAKIICGSWSSELEYFKTTNTQMGSLKEKIDDAMKEQTTKEQQSIFDVHEIDEYEEKEDLMTLSSMD